MEKELVANRVPNTRLQNRILLYMKRHHEPLKSIIKSSRQSYRRLIGPVRKLPDFIIIGTQKGGTTFLHRLLQQHPQVKPPLEKEIHYFDLNFSRGNNWYKSHFPVQKLPGSREYVTGEASPYYLFHPHAARRAATVVPAAKLIVLLRNPVDRAYSHYHHQVRLKGQGHETLSFEDAIGTEEERLGGETEKMLRDEHYFSLPHRNYSYLSRGVYVDQLCMWSEFFRSNQMLVLKSEDLYDHTDDTFRRVTSFLGLKGWRPETYPSTYRGDYTGGMGSAVKQRLEEYFRPHNQRLYKYLGIDLGW